MRSISRFIPLIVLLAGCYPRLSRAQTASSENAFRPYTTCSLPGGPSVVETAPLAPGVTTRSVQTILGMRPVEMLDGRRVMFAYPDEDFYANIKVEILPAESWEKSRSTLVDNFDFLLASGDDVRNYHLKPELHGFAMQGQDRQKREGGVLGFYLLFDDRAHTVATIYFLNQEPPVRFKTMEEYALLRDRFLNQYTACIRSALSQR
jgi:hypothetical protein